MNTAQLHTGMSSNHWSGRLSNMGGMHEYEPMSRHTTLGVGGPARWFFRPVDSASLSAALAMTPADVAILPLGRGSNLLLPDTGFDGMVIDFSALKDLHIDGCKVIAGAGVRMGRFARQCADSGLTGAEFMATVPGDIGGGVVMNAGAFSQQVSDILVSIDIVHRNGESGQVAARDLCMAYRQTILPAGSLVVGARFELVPDRPDDIRERIRSMRSRRSATQPLAQANCGSVFKNPQGDYAARLIEAAGLKGFTIGGAQISERHANFIVNDGEASSADIMALIRHVQRAVKKEFDVHLEPEVCMAGEWI
jgi:UDP-N-acetylmuramate dehydrogenase